MQGVALGGFQLALARPGFDNRKRQQHVIPPRDDLDLGRRRLQSPELDAPATRFVKNLSAIRRDIAQRSDLIVMVAGGNRRRES